MELGGYASVRGIAKFGERAVPQLLQALHTAHHTDKAGVLMALAIIVEGRPGEFAPATLSSASLERIRAGARELLRPGLDRSLLPRAARLALVVRDPGLRREVERLALERDKLVPYGATDDKEIEGLQNRLRKELDDHP
jgi:hypothetical protein